MFYGPDGQVLTDDEASFLNANSISSTFPNGGALLGLTLNNITSGDGAGASGYGVLMDGDDFNPDMDPMVQEAYLQFLRNQ